MIEDVRPEGCVCEPCSDISPNWEDIRTKIGYTMLGEIGRMHFSFPTHVILPHDDNLKWALGIMKN